MENRPLEYQDIAYDRFVRARQGSLEMELPRAGEEELNADESGRARTMTAPRPQEKAHGSHPTQKPVSLLERVIERDLW